MVLTEIFPELVAVGTVESSEVAVAALIAERVVLNFVRLLPGVVSKLAPVIVTAVPAVPIVGVKLVMVGGSTWMTSNDVELEADPLGVVTEIAPVVAPDGTVATSFVNEADVTVAAVPLNVTVF